MIDIVASIAILFGSVLMLLGALGLLRFPDVFTRMHAATKTATVGVIAITGAAAIEAGAVGGTLVLLLVVGLLFLSGPLGMSMLARASYHDPETPRSPKTREVVVDRPDSVATIMRISRGTNLVLAFWLCLVWIALFGSLGLPVLVGGALAAAATAYVLRVIAPRWPNASFRPLATLKFLGFFLSQLVGATWEVVRLVWSDPDKLSPGVVVVPLAASRRSVATLLANAVSFTPGSIALEIHDGRLFVHAIDIDDPEQLVASVKQLEGLIIAAFGDAVGGAVNDPLIT